MCVFTFHFLRNNFFMLFIIRKNLHESSHKSSPLDPTVVRLKLHKLYSFQCLICSIVHWRTNRYQLIHPLHDLKKQASVPNFHSVIYTPIESMSRDVVL